MSPVAKGAKTKLEWPHLAAVEHMRLNTAGSGHCEKIGVFDGRVGDVEDCQKVVDGTVLPRAADRSDSDMKVLISTPSDGCGGGYARTGYYCVGACAPGRYCAEFFEVPTSTNVLIMAYMRLKMLGVV